MKKLIIDDNDLVKFNRKHLNACRNILSNNSISLNGRFIHKCYGIDCCDCPFCRTNLKKSRRCVDIDIVKSSEKLVHSGNAK